MEKTQAARILDDELFEIKEAIRKSRAMLNELGNSYFGKIIKYDFEDLVMLFHSHGYYEPYYDIAFDYIVKADKKLEELLSNDVTSEEESIKTCPSMNVEQLKTNAA